MNQNKMTNSLISVTLAQFELFDIWNFNPPSRPENIMSLRLSKKFFFLKFHASSQQSGSLQALIFYILKS